MDEKDCAAPSDPRAKTVDALQRLLTQNQYVVRVVCRRDPVELKRSLNELFVRLNAVVGLDPAMRDSLHAMSSAIAVLSKRQGAAHDTTTFRLLRALQCFKDKVVQLAEEHTPQEKLKGDQDLWSACDADAWSLV